MSVKVPEYLRQEGNLQLVLDTEALGEMSWCTRGHRKVKRKRQKMVEEGMQWYWNKLAKYMDN